MACCGKRRNAVPQNNMPAPTPATAPAYPKGVTASTSGAGVVLEYTGQNVANQTICGPSLTRYKYGRNSRYLRVWVRAEDVEFMLETRLFKRVIPQAPAAPQPQARVTIEPEVVQEAEAPTAAPQVEASPRAQELAEHYGVDVEAIPHAGSRVLVRDVQEYLRGMGVAI